MILVDYPRLEIFIVSPQGELLSRLGGRGSGPGEFQRMMILDWFETDIFKATPSELSFLSQSACLF